MKRILTLAVTAICALACSRTPDLCDASLYTGEIDGKPVSLYTLKAGDIILQTTNYGAHVVGLWTPDRNGKLGDVAVGRASLDEYVNFEGERFLGPVVGPVANRIGKGQFTVDGVPCQVPLNNNGNTLHGGNIGLDLLVWDVVSASDTSITFSIVHPDGLEGWPGNLSVEMTYALKDDNSFEISYKATTDAATPVNMSNHTFFNLSGDCSKTVNGYELQIFASNTTPVDSLLIPTGEIASVIGTPLDFTQPHTIGERVDADCEWLRNGNGYDHNWILDRKTGSDVELAATVFDPESGRVLEVLTDQPGLQFYGGNFFDGKISDKHGNAINYRSALALETQKWPDGINHDNFPETLLRPGEVYTHTCIYRFSVR